MDSGVYSFVSSVDGRRYVGAAADMGARKKRHLYKLRLGSHSNKEFQESFDKNGESSFKFEVLERCPPDHCATREGYWVAKFFSKLFYTGSAAMTSGVPGSTHKEETKAKISEALQGKSKAETHKDNLWANRRGWKHSEESKNKTSKTLLDKIANGERFGWPLGKKHSEESKSKMSLARKGKPKSADHRAKIAAAVKAARARKRDGK